MSAVESFLRKIPQYTRNARHLRSVVQHGSMKKWGNLVLAEMERKFHRVELKSLPYILIIDPCNFCNLRCPLCPTGVKDLGREQSMMTLESFKKYFDPLAPYLLEAYMHNWGESLINKDTCKMIEYATGKNVGTNLSSNLVTLDSDDIDSLLDCGLEYLVVSLDGTSQDTYEQYRVRGDFERAMDNMAEIIRRRNLRGQKIPAIEWQFIVMKQNEHQVDEAQKLADKIGVDVMRFIPVGMPMDFKNRKELADKWFPENVKGKVESTHEEQKFGQDSRPGPCFYLYRSMVVNADGGVSPCCEVYREKSDFISLNMPEINVRELWNSPVYQSARSLFSSTALTEYTRSVCDGCDIFIKHPSKSRHKEIPVIITKN